MDGCVYHYTVLGTATHLYCSACVNSAFHPLWDIKLSQLLGWVVIIIIIKRDDGCGAAWYWQTRISSGWLVWRLIAWTTWTLAMALPWWEHHRPHWYCCGVAAAAPSPLLSPLLPPLITTTPAAITRSTLQQSRPNKAGLKCPSVHPFVRTYVRTSVRPQKVSSISVKFGR